MTLVQRLSREPNLILGVITTGLSLAVLFGVDITSDQMAGIGIFLGAVIALVRFITTPAAEVAAQVPAGKAYAVAGPAAQVEDGTFVNVVTKAGNPVA